MQLRILTLNIWGVHYVAKLIPQRIQALIQHLLDSDTDYDIIGLQEVIIPRIAVNRESIV